jgi:hypothetical protein
MSKRILSWVLSCALLLGCLSGLTLFVSAESTVTAFDPFTNYWYNGQSNAGEKDGFTVVKIGNTESGGGSPYCFWNNQTLLKAFGFTEQTLVDSLTVEWDYYMDEGVNWVGFNLNRPNAEGAISGQEWTAAWDFSWNGNNDTYTATWDKPFEKGKWTTLNITFPTLSLGGGDDISFKIGDAAANSSIYIRGMKYTAKVGENTYTTLWGSYTTAKLDFTSGEVVGFNANITHNHPDEDDADGNGIFEVAEGTGIKGIKMSEQNRGFGMKLANLCVTGDMAVTVEYYMPADVVGDNTRFNMSFNGNNHILRVGGATFDGVVNGPGTNLVRGAAATYTYVVSGEDAAALASGASINNIFWHGVGGNTDYYYILSVSVAPASILTSVENPGYEYYDFTKSYAENPYYANYKKLESYGVGYSFNGSEGVGTVTDAGLAMESGALYLTVTDAKAEGEDAKPVAAVFTFAEGTTGTFNMNYQSTTDNWTAKNDNAIDESGKTIVVLNDAKFTNGANGGSMRLYIGGKTLERVEVIVLADKTALNEAIAKEVNFEGKTTASIAAYNAALEAAQAVAANELATQKEADAAVAALAAAEAALKDILVIGTEGPVTVSYKDFVFMSEGIKDEGNNIGFTGDGKYVDYQINVTTSGWYKVVVPISTGNGNAKVQLRDGDNNVYQEWTISGEGSGWANYLDREAEVLLRSGVQIVRIFFVGDGSNFKDFTIEKIEDKPLDTAALEAAVNKEINLDEYTEETVNAYKAALEAAKAVLADENADQFAVNDALAALQAAEAGLKVPTKPYADINFADDQINTVNGNITHNHPNEDDADGNGIFEVAADSGIYGIKMSKQNRGFGFNIINGTEWLAEGQLVQVVVSYYAPSDAVQDNSRLGFLFPGDSWYRARVGEVTDPNVIAGQNLVASGLKKDEVGSFRFVLNETDSATIRNGASFNIFFWNYNDNAETGGDYIYITDVKVSGVADMTALQAAVDAAKDMSNYTKDSAAAYTAALDAAKAVLANAAASQEEVDAALAALQAADEALVELPSMLVAASGDIEVEHNGVAALEFVDRWAFFKFMDRMGIEAGDYNLDVTFYYAATGVPWWQIQLSGVAEEGNRYSEDGKYSDVDGFQQTPDWLVSSNDAWTMGTVSFEGVRLPADTTNWASKPDSSGQEFDFGMHICGDGTNPNLYIRGVEFTVTDAEGNEYTAMWGTKPTIDVSALQDEVDAAITDLSLYSESTAKAYSDALAAAKALLAAPTSQDDVDAALQKLVAAKAKLVVETWDLVVVDITTDKGKAPAAGETVKFVATIKNIGNKDIPAGSKFGGVFYVDGTVVAWSDNMKDGSAPELKAGATMTLTSCGGPNDGDGSWTVVEGEYTVKFFVNDNEGDGIPNEASRENNELEVKLPDNTPVGPNTDELQAEVDAEIEDLSGYDADSAKAYTDALAAAKAVLAKADATQEEVNAALAALKAAKEGLTAKPAGEELQLGDVNFDGAVDSSDARIVLQAAVGKVTLSEKELAVADADESGEIDSSDARVILQVSVGKAELGKITWTEEA